MHRPARTESNRKYTSLFSYHLLPACARSCKILHISEGNCLPPAAPTSNLSTYRNCICQSDYLRSLHSSRVICHDVCNDEYDEVIHGYYHSMCTSPEPSKTTTTSIPVFTVSPAAVAATVAFTLSNHPTLPAPAPPETGQNSAKGELAWFDQNAKYLAIAAGMILAIVVALLGIVYYRRGSDHSSNLASQQVQSRSIALQSLTSQSAQPLHLNAEQDRHLKTSANSDLLFFYIQSPLISSPFARPIPSHRFGDTVRVYAETKSGEVALGNGGTEGHTTPVRSLSRTERLIRERIRTTGRPDIPISATPKITR